MVFLFSLKGWLLIFVIDMKIVLFWGLIIDLYIKSFLFLIILEGFNRFLLFLYLLLMYFRINILLLGGIESGLVILIFVYEYIWFLFGLRWIELLFILRLWFFENNIVDFWFKKFIFKIFLSWLLFNLIIRILWLYVCLLSFILNLRFFNNFLRVFFGWF